MAETSEGFVALPGGSRTQEEFFEALTWAQLGEHERLCGLLNTNGYYDPVLTVFDHMVERGFVSVEHRKLVLVEPVPTAMLDAFTHYSPPKTIKWTASNEA